MIRVIRIASFFVFFSLMLTQLTQADDGDRHVEGGDILQTATASSPLDESTAVFLATQEAVRALMDECGGFPHRATVIYKKRSFRVWHGDWRATVQAGLEMSLCHEAQTATPQRKKELTNKALAHDQVVYEDMIHPNGKTADDDESSGTRFLEREMHALTKEVRQIRQPGTIVIQKTVAAPDKSSQDSARRCREERDRLNEQARVMAMSNGGPGNYEGESLDLHNRAMSMNCPEE